MTVAYPRHFAGYFLLITWLNEYVLTNRLTARKEV